MEANPWAGVAAAYEAEAEGWLERVVCDRDRTQVEAWLARFHACAEQAAAARRAAAWWAGLA